MTEHEALKLALEALEYSGNIWHIDCPKDKAITAIKEALAGAEGERQPEQEPDYYGLTSDHLWMSITKDHYNKLKPEFRMACYTTPPQRKPLTDEQRREILKDNTIQGYQGEYFDAWGIIDDVEAAHGIKEST